MAVETAHPVLPAVLSRAERKAKTVWVWGVKVGCYTFSKLGGDVPSDVYIDSLLDKIVSQTEAGGRAGWTGVSFACIYILYIVVALCIYLYIVLLIYSACIELGIVKMLHIWVRTFATLKLPLPMSDIRRTYAVKWVTLGLKR